MNGSQARSIRHGDGIRASVLSGGLVDGEERSTLRESVADL
jgi:hypothetical protein